MQTLKLSIHKRSGRRGGALVQVVRLHQRNLGGDSQVIRTGIKIQVASTANRLAQSFAVYTQNRYNILCCFNCICRLFHSLQTMAEQQIAKQHGRKLNMNSSPLSSMTHFVRLRRSKHWAKEHGSLLQLVLHLIKISKLGYY